MSFNPENTFLGVARSGGGSLYIGAPGATVPTDASTAIPTGPTGFINAGIITVDGEQFRNGQTVEPKRDRNGKLFRNIFNERDRGVELSFEEWTQTVYKFLFGNETVTATDEDTWAFEDIADAVSPVLPLVFDYVDKQMGRYVRIVVFAGQVIASAESLAVTGTDTAPLTANIQFLIPEGGRSYYKVYFAPLDAEEEEGGE